MTTINGATALVTGGQRGLGLATVSELLAAGAAKVYATARTPVPSDDSRIVPLPLEVTDQGSVDALVKAAGDVSIVVNNAGAGMRESLLSNDIDDVKALFDVNVFGPLRVAKAFAPVLATNGGGTLVDIHSVLSWAAGFGAYGATKAALWSVTNSLRLELAPQGTRVTGVHVGYIDTDLISDLDVPKLDARDVARQIVAAIEEDEPEVLADEVSRHIKSALSGPVSGLNGR
jgi:NAD(P)-dependent dehydrogenase (short-subunit alcohol dehydrogenase family)